APAPALAQAPGTGPTGTQPVIANQPISANVSRHARVVVTFANEPRQAPTSAGSTGRHYSGDGYLLAQSAHRQSKRVAAKYSLREIANWPIRALAVHCVVYEIPDDRSVTTVVQALTRDANVALAEPLSEFHTLTQTQAPYNDPLYDLQTNLQALDIANAHNRSQGAGVRIALIDTGVDIQHPDLEGRIARTRSFIDTPARSAAAYRHGTAMAGLIVAVANNHVGIVGIAPRAQLEVLEACWQLRPDNDAAVCNTFTLAKALAAAIDDGVPLVNMSIAGPPDPLLAALVAAAVKHGVIVVGAAAEPAEAFPTAIAGVMAAQGLQHSLKPGAFSVPADHVLTLRPGAQYDFETGTSVAAAELTGIVALMLSASGGRLPRDTLVAVLEKTATPAVDINAALSKLELERRLAARATR
ncbi:MAG TPA: S8 family serine peptidase, partial [Steroidobacteraceae bacterium]|nr:S8 family serine peptidase [Steroidobacteraceae bacterium]